MFSRLSASQAKRLFSFFPPYFGTGIHVSYISEDWRELHVQMKLRWYNKNVVGTHFGGSLYAMIDPHLMLLLMRNLGEDYYVWDKAATIDFVAPGRTDVKAKMHITEADLEKIRAATAAGDPYFVDFAVEILDANDALVSKCLKTLYVRKKPG